MITPLRHDLQKGEGKEIEVALFVLPPSKYGAARREAPKIRKNTKNFSYEYKKDKDKIYRKNIII